MLQMEHSVILSTFIKLPITNKNFVLSIFEWLFYTGFTVHNQQITSNQNLILKICSLIMVQKYKIVLRINPNAEYLVRMYIL